MDKRASPPTDEHGRTAQLAEPVRLFPFIGSLAPVSMCRGRGSGTVVGNVCLDCTTRYESSKRVGPAEMPFQNWYTANTNHFLFTD